MAIEGSCLCGGVQFTLSGPVPGIVQCHCSLCRRVSGTAVNAMIITSSGQLNWICGEELIVTYERPSGYGNAFCKVCGSPVPDAIGAGKGHCVPAGALADCPEIEVAMHIHVGSKVHWDIIGGDAPRFDEGPPR